MHKLVSVVSDACNLVQNSPVLALLLWVEWLDDFVNLTDVLGRLFRSCFVDRFMGSTQVLISDDKLSRVVDCLSLPGVKACLVNEA